MPRDAVSRFANAGVVRDLSRWRVPAKPVLKRAILIDGEIASSLRSNEAIKIAIMMVGIGRVQRATRFNENICVRPSETPL